MEPKEIESLNCVEMMMPCDSAMMVQTLVFHGLPLQLSYLMGWMKVVVHQSMVMACWVRGAASNDYASAVVSGQDDDGTS